MNVTPSGINGRRLKLLVAIACFGEKNLGLLKRIIQAYKSMDMDVDVVVVSDAQKDVGPGAKLLVGMPSKNPWSLPFAHKAVLAQGVDNYDLFIYSEDDMGVTEQNIHAFLRATAQLAPDEIAGFLRYEVDKSGERAMPDVHGAFHWKPESVKRRGDYTVAEYTNEHAALFILTQAQLKKAIASGGFLRGPCEGRYDMACTASTDPYLNCGFRKVVCISALEDFLIHHLSNRYVGQIGLPLSAFMDQVKTLLAIADGKHPAATLCETETSLLHGKWSKSYYEKPTAELLELVPAETKSVLSIGCGWGVTEAKLKDRGAKVTAAALDSVIGAVAAGLGLEMLYGTLEECFRKLEGRTFDCVLITNLLHLLPDPHGALAQYSRFVRVDGTLVVSGPNFSELRTFAKRMLGKGEYAKLRSYGKGGISICGPGSLSRTLAHAGMKVATVRWPNHAIPRGGIQVPLDRLKADDWILQAQR